MSTDLMVPAGSAGARALLVLALALAGCSGDKGDSSDGAGGSDGSTGTDEADGTDASDGTDGTAGTDGDGGADGGDGADGGTVALNGSPPDSPVALPTFAATNSDGSARGREDLLGSPTVMWFYPLAASGG